MVYVYLDGHELSYEVFELLRLFYSDKDIKIIKKKALVDNQGLLIESYLVFVDNVYSVETIISRDKEVIGYHKIENVDRIDIKEENINKKVKIGIKQSLFIAVSKIVDIDIPWGILTGIRPTKIVHELMDIGYENDIIFEVLTDEYLISERKANLILSIAKGERKYVYPVSDDKFSLYVSIPFCPTRCVYCSFPSNSLKRWGDLVDEYTRKLLYEIEKVGELSSDKRIDTVYIGGGTPTSIPIDNLERIIRKIHETFGYNNIREFTVEAGRPDTINKDMLLMLKNNKVDRISINPQTMSSSTLTSIGRNHTPDDIIKTYNLAREIGFNYVNMDVIVGLPNEGIDDITYTMEEIKKLNPDNLTVHTMAIKKASKLKENIGQYNLANQKLIEDMLNITEKYAKEMNLHPYYMYRQKQILGNYENVGYSKKDKECIYNILIMEERQTIIAVGAGGISKIYKSSENRIERVPNVKGLKEYLERIDEMIERKKNSLKILT